MIDNSAAFVPFTDNGTAIAQIVQSIREKIEGAAQPLVTANAIIEDIIGAVPYPITDVREARVMAQRLAVKSHELNYQIVHVHEMVEEAAAYAKTYIADPSKQWMWTSEDQAAATELRSEVKGVDVQVAVDSTGKIKKGGKQVLVLELYKKHVLEAETPMTNKEFIEVVMSDLQMSKAGASTYAWNARKELGEPEGGIVKAKKGRKAKEAV
jgi:hypothetical protein